MIQAHSRPTHSSPHGFLRPVINIKKTTGIQLYGFKFQPQLMIQGVDSDIARIKMNKWQQYNLTVLPSMSSLSRIGTGRSSCETLFPITSATAMPMIRRTMTTRCQSFGACMHTYGEEQREAHAVCYITQAQTMKGPISSICKESRTEWKRWPE